MKSSIVTIFLLVFSVSACKQKSQKASDDSSAPKYSQHLKKVDVNKENWLAKDEKYWKSVLTPLQFSVCRQVGTERAFTGYYDKFYEAGTYVCSSCGLPLFDAKSKYDSKTGWPSYYEPINEKAVETKPDYKYGLKRVEVVCSRCKAHLGHVFEDGPEPTGLRYCMNSVCLLHKKPHSPN